MDDEMKRKAEATVASFRRPIDSNSPRKHHYIPQFHLRRFVNDDGMLLVVPASDSKPERLSKPENVAVIKDFYTTFEPGVGDTVMVENLLGLVEGEASGAVARAAAGVLFPPQLKDRQSLAMWAALQYVRGPVVRREMEALTDYTAKLPFTEVRTHAQAKACLERTQEAAPSDEDVERFLKHCQNLRDLRFVAPQNNHIQLMLEIGDEVALHLVNRNISVVKFAGNGLMLSNRPVVLFKHEPEPLRGVGIATADEIGIALDRNTALIFHSDDQLADTVLRAPQEQIVDWNRHVAHFPTDEVYCHPDDRHMVPPLRDISDEPLFQIDGAFGKSAETDGINAPPERTSPFRFAATRPNES